jgi:uncharacterized protein
MLLSIQPMGGAMDNLSLIVFCIAAFIGGFASGLAGFAMGFIVTAVWLHLVTPVETIALVVGCSLWTQGYGVWKLRKSLNWGQIAPFILAGTAGVPLGIIMLGSFNPDYVRAGIGILLLVYGCHGLLQPRFNPLHVGKSVDAGIGFLNGALCGLTGLPGFIITVWCQMRGWPKDMQRTVFQPVMLAASVATGLSLIATRQITWRIGELYLIALPALIAGLWLGFQLYGKLDDASFRKVLLWLLVFAGVTLLAGSLGKSTSVQLAFQIF